MAFKLVVWDFDGTIADSLPSAVSIFNRLAPEMGFRRLEDVEAARAMPTRELMRRHGVSLWRLPRLVRRYQAAVAEEADRMRLVAGVADLLAAVSATGVRQGVLSSNSEHNIRRTLRAHGAEGHFAFVVGYPRLFGKGKALRRVVRAEGGGGFWRKARELPAAARLAGGDVLYVGDEVRDIDAARKAGVKVAAVTWGFHTAEFLRSGKPDFVVGNARELLELVKGPAGRSAAP
jgi:phosphoglycolate phosphatase